jgi:hypothetical protein
MPQASESNEGGCHVQYALGQSPRSTDCAAARGDSRRAFRRSRRCFADQSEHDLHKLPDQITWEAARNRPPNTVEQALLWGKSSEPGLYYYLVKWYPGFMSAPHWYETDRLCVVVSGTWWVASGEDFEPNDTVPMPAGSFIRRVARTPHYDGVKKDGREPAVIAICGTGPITYHVVDPSKPDLRVL